MPLVKPTPKSALAAPANVVHLVQLVNPARMVLMVNPAKTEIREAQARMLARTRNCCQSHHNANAKLSPAQLVQSDQREPMDHPEMLAALVPMDSPAHKAHLAHLDLLVPTATLVLLAHLVLLVP